MKKTILFIIILWANLLCSQNNSQATKVFTVKDLENEIKLNNDWKTQAGTNILWKEKDFNDKNWKPLTSNFHKFIAPDFNGEMWFRKQLQIDSTLVNVPVFMQLYSKGNIDIYLNGTLLQKIKSLNNTPDSLKNKPHIFVFKNPGNNVLALHYKDSLFNKKETTFQAEGFKLSLLSSKKHFEKSELNNYLWLAVIAIGCIFITLGVIHLMLFGFYRKFIANLFFAIFNLCSGCSIILGYSKFLQLGIEGFEFTNVNNPTSITFSVIGSLAISATVNFLFSKNKLRLIILSILVGICLLLMYVVSINFSFLASIFTTILFIESIIVVLTAAINKKPGAKIIAIGLVCSFGFALILGLIVGVLVVTKTFNTFLIPILTILGVLSFFSIPFAMSAYLASNFAAVSRKLKEQIKHVNQLSNQTLKQEQERKTLLENKTAFLETEVIERTKEIEIQKQEIIKQQEELLKEKQKSEDLLLNILPKDVANELKEHGESKVKQFSSVSILFSDFINLDSVSQQLNSQELLDELNYCFQAFDHITTKHQIEKIKTISYSYMAVSGLPLENENHAKKMIEVALEMCSFIENYQTKRKKQNKPYFEIKIGINSGEVVAGIVGIKKFAYDIWGDAVNTAARMKAKSENGRINVGHTTYDLAKNFFKFTYRGEIEIKGKGLAKMYFVETKTI